MKNTDICCWQRFYDSEKGSITMLIIFSGFQKIGVSYQNKVLCSTKQTLMTPAATRVNCRAAVELQFFSVENFTLSYSQPGENMCSLRFDGNNNDIQQTHTCFRHREPVWCCKCKRFVLRLLRSRWVADLYSVWLASCLCLPHILVLRKELAYCQQHTESHYFITDNRWQCRCNVYVQLYTHSTLRYRTL